MFVRYALYVFIENDLHRCDSGLSTGSAQSTFGAISSVTDVETNSLEDNNDSLTG